MPAYLKFRPVWSQLLTFIGLSLAIFMVVMLLGTLVLAKMTGLSLMQVGDISNWDMSNPRTLFLFRGMLLLQFIGLFVLPVFAFAYFSDEKPLRYIGLSQPVIPAYIGAGVFIMLISLPLAGWLGMLNQEFPFSPSMERWLKEMEDSANGQIEYMLGQKGVDQLLANLFFVAFFAGMGEELFFRGIIQRLLIKWFRSPWAGIIVTAAIFSAIHLQFYGFLPRMMLGILLGAIYWYSGSLWPAILAHFIYDGFLIFLAYLDPAKISSNTPVDIGGPLAIQALVSLALIIVVLRWMHKKSTNSFESFYASDRIDHRNPFAS